MSNRQTVFFLLVNPMDKEHKDPETIDLEAPRLALYMHTARKKHQKHGVLGRHQTCSKERIKVLSDAIERNHLLRHVPSLLYPEKLLGWELEKSYMRKKMRHLDFLRRFPSKTIG